MDEFTDIFSSEVATRVYVIVSLVFVLLYARAFFCCEDGLTLATGNR